MMAMMKLWFGWEQEKRTGQIKVSMILFVRSSVSRPPIVHMLLKDIQIASRRYKA